MRSSRRYVLYNEGKGARTGSMRKSVEVEKELASVVEAIVRRYRPEKIILFGSLARGEDSEESDIDLLIVKRTATRRIYRRIEALKGIPRSVPLDVLVLTPEEIDFLEKEQSPFIREILAEGKVLYERESLA